MALAMKRLYVKALQVIQNIIVERQDVLNMVLREGDEIKCNQLKVKITLEIFEDDAITVQIKDEKGGFSYETAIIRLNEKITVNDFFDAFIIRVMELILDVDLAIAKEKAYQDFFNFMADEHGLSLTDDQLSEIVREVQELMNKIDN